MGKSSNLKYTVLGPVLTIVTQEKNLAVTIVSQMPAQNLPERGKKANQILGTSRKQTEYKDRYVLL